jgi:hypothetical protein
MSYYKITFIVKPDSRWVEAANRSLIMPAVVANLLRDSKEEIVTGCQLDAICEWDRTICKQSGSRSQIDYWPTECAPAIYNKKLS